MVLPKISPKSRRSIGEKGQNLVEQHLTQRHEKSPDISPRCKPNHPEKVGEQSGTEAEFFLDPNLLAYKTEN